MVSSSVGSGNTTITIGDMSSNVKDIEHLSESSQKNALSTWQRKLSRLQNEEAIAADPSIKFQLQEQIQECQDKIKELG